MIARVIELNNRSFAVRAITNRVMKKTKPNATQKESQLSSLLSRMLWLFLLLIWNRDFAKDRLVQSCRGGRTYYSLYQ